MTTHSTAAIKRPATLPGGVHLFTLVPPSQDDIEAGVEPTGTQRALTDIDGEYLLERLGDTDLNGDPDTRLRGMADRTSVRRETVVAAHGPVADRLAAAGTTALPAATLPGEEDPTPAADDVLGYTGVGLDLLDNTHTFGIEVFTRAPYRRRGIGSALWGAGTGIGRADGRTTIQSWLDHEVPDEGAERLEPTGSEGAIGVDDAARFALDRGLVLEQVECHSVLRVAGRAERWRADLDEALAHATATDEIVTWADATPEADLEHMAELKRRMSTDVPLGGLDLEEEAWDAERVRIQEATQLAAGQRKYLTTAVRDTSTGVLVAFSRITIPVGRPAAWQDDTLVMKEHRGRRLGTVVKLVNQLALLEQYPGVERIHTWNAFENRHMLAVNHAVGFELASLGGAWQGLLR